MAVRSPWDFPPDDSGALPFEDDVDIPGQFRGKGQGFGLSPTSGTSLTTPGPDVPPASGLAGVDWRHPFARTPVAPGQPELLTGPNVKNPMSWLTMGANLYPPARLPVLAGAGILASTPTAMDEAPTNMWNQRPSGVAPSQQRGMPWPDTGVAPTGAPIGSPAPAVPPVRPSAAVPSAVPSAVAAQQPNLGAYTTFDRPNMSPQNSLQGRQGAPQMGMLDLSRLFGGGQPTAAPAAAPASILARPDLTQRVPLAQTPLPPPKPVVYQKVGQSVKLKPKFKSSSSSQGGGLS